MSPVLEMCVPTLYAFVHAIHKVDITDTLKGKSVCVVMFPYNRHDTCCGCLPLLECSGNTDNIRCPGKTSVPFRVTFRIY